MSENFIEEICRCGGRLSLHGWKSPGTALEIIETWRGEHRCEGRKNQEVRREDVSSLTSGEPEYEIHCNSFVAYEGQPRTYCERKSIPHEVHWNNSKGMKWYTP